MQATGPIIKNLTDTDRYKTNMQQVIYHRFTGAEVEYHTRFRNAKVDLTPYIGEIEEELEAYCSLRYTPKELEIVGRERYVANGFVEFLELFQPRMKHIRVVRDSSLPGGIDIVSKGPWLYTIPFELAVLPICSEVYFRNTTDVEERMQVGMERLKEKVRLAQQHPMFSRMRFSDFGTRRRFSREWHERVVRYLKETIPNQFIGSSNMHLADKYNLVSTGTQAHEFYMAMQALGPRLRDSQKYALDVWTQEFKGDNGIALTDVIGMDAFLPDFDRRHSKQYDGMRHDSGDPFVWARKAIRHYESMQIDPRIKTLIFSNKLDFPLALDLLSEFHGQINVAFGIGTDLTNDTGVPALDAVMKMTECNGQPVAKLSDDPGKTMCRNPQYVKFLASEYQHPFSD